MYVAQAVDVGQSPLEFWQWAGHDRGAALRALGTRMAEAGPVRDLLRFAHPYEDQGHRIGFDIEMRPQSGPGGTILVCWDAHFARLEGELEVASSTSGASQLRLTASYEPAWAAAALQDRRTLQRLSGQAVRAFLEQLATTAPPVVPAEPPRPVPAPSVLATKHRVLIEDEDPAWHQFIIDMADADEYEFASCRGPFLADGGCPVLRGETCPKVEWADSILHSLDRTHPANGALWDALQRRNPDFAPTVLGGQPAAFCLTRRAMTPAV
jgi:hypothetical protein